MNNRTETHTTSMNTPAQAPEGYVHLVSTANIFDMDLVAKNLQMNGIDAVWSNPDPVEQPEDPSLLFVKAEQKEQAVAVLTSLDLNDFTIPNGR
ncbi:MAG: hypothetical protein ACOYNS_06915 [Bacteroidota bacterium]